MALVLRCADVTGACPAEVRGDSEDDVLQQAAEHARTAHGMTELDQATVTAVRGAIRQEG